jgi:hypothetical protein
MVIEVVSKIQQQLHCLQHKVAWRAKYSVIMCLLWRISLFGFMWESHEYRSTKGNFKTALCVFATRYRARECNKVNNCRKCRGSHHQSICATDHPKHENKQNPADQNVEDAAAKSETSLNKPEQVISTTANTGSGVQPKSYYRQQLSIYALI